MSTRPCQDVFNLAIDLLEEDVEALQACSLTCNAWYSRSKTLIHSRFTFDGTTTSNDRLLCYVQHPELLSCIRTLVVKKPARQYRQWTGCYVNPTSASYTALQEVVFPSVTNLMLRHINPRHEGANTLMPYVQSNFPSLTSLVLRQWSFASFSELHILIMAFPRLNSLSLLELRTDGKTSSPRDSWNETPDDPVSEDHSDFPRHSFDCLRRLTIDFSMGAMQFLRYLNYHQVKAPVTFADVRWVCKDKEYKDRCQDPELLRLVCSFVGDSLKHLRILDGYFLGDMDGWNAIHRCQNLRTIELHTSVYYGPSRLQRIVSEIEHVQLEILAVHLNPQKQFPEFKTEWTVQAWSELDDFLLSKTEIVKKHCGKTRLTIPISLRRNDSFESIVERFRKFIPKIISNGVLELGYHA
ncbi:unnamed protein product [Somion occarium]|uniref:F-box domain-containing protein n=1 Tax=Somion occarium TaxID=3059160 RepID=A0ABP1CVM6_9APHY